MAAAEVVTVVVGMAAALRVGATRAEAPRAAAAVAAAGTAEATLAAGIRVVAPMAGAEQEAVHRAEVEAN